MVHCIDYGHTWPEDHWHVSFYWLVPVHSKLSSWAHSKLQSIFCRTNLSRKWLCLLQASSVYYTILYAKTWAQEWGMDHKRSRGEARTLHTGGLNKKYIYFLVSSHFLSVLETLLRKLILSLAQKVTQKETYLFFLALISRLYFWKDSWMLGSLQSVITVIELYAFRLVFFGHPRNPRYSDGFSNQQSWSFPAT